MLRSYKFAFASVATLATALLSPIAAQAQVNVNIYSGFTDNAGGAPFSGLVGSFTSPDIMFATNTGYNWHPFELSRFGADITGCINVVESGTYTFLDSSDDGSLLLIDSATVVDNGGPHSPGDNSGSAFLTAGIHELEVQYFEDFGGPAGLNITLPSGVSYTPCPNVPEPGSVAMLVGMGLSGLGFVARRRARR